MKYINRFTCLLAVLLCLGMSSSVVAETYSYTFSGYFEPSSYDDSFPIPSDGPMTFAGRVVYEYPAPNEDPNNPNDDIRVEYVSLKVNGELVPDYSTETFWTWGSTLDIIGGSNPYTDGRAFTISYGDNGEWSPLFNDHPGKFFGLQTWVIEINHFPDDNDTYIGISFLTGERLPCTEGCDEEKDPEAYGVGNSSWAVYEERLRGDITGGTIIDFPTMYRYPPDRPTGIRATDGDFPNRVQISFSPVAGATKYRIFRCPDNGYNCGLPIGYPTAPTFIDTKGNSEQVYYYRVRACGANRCGKFSVADTGFTTPAPDRPTVIRATDGAFENRVQVTFNTVEKATVYRVFRCSDKGYDCGLPVGFPRTGTFDDKKGSSGTVYYYRVRACTPTTCGKFSVANAGHRAAINSTESDENMVIVNSLPNLSVNNVPIPSLNDVGRWLLILTTLGFGLLLINRRYLQR